MTRALLALLLTGCLQGGQGPLEGRWESFVDKPAHVTLVLGERTEGTGPFFFSYRTETYDDIRIGTYTADEEWLHLVSETNVWDVRYGMGDVPDVLLLTPHPYKWMWLHREAP